MAARKKDPNPAFSPKLVAAAKELGFGSVADLVRDLVGRGHLEPAAAPFEVQAVEATSFGATLVAQMRGSGRTMLDAYRDLASWQQESVIVHLIAAEGNAPLDVAATLQLGIQEVTQIYQGFTRKHGELLQVTTLPSILGHMQMRSDDLYSRALRVDDLKTALSTLQFQLRFYQDVGIISKSPQEVHHTVTVDVESEINRLVELRMREQVRSAKRITASGPTVDHGGGMGPDPRSPDSPGERDRSDVRDHREPERKGDTRDREQPPGRVEEGREGADRSDSGGGGGDSAGRGQGGGHTVDPGGGSGGDDGSARHGSP